MKKILFVTTISPTIQAFLLPIARHFQKQGCRVDGMANGIMSCPECIEILDQIWEIDWSRNPLDLKNLRNAPQRMREIVAQENYDLVHVHTPVAAFVTRYALRDFRRFGNLKVIYTAHGFHFYKGEAFFKNMIFSSLEKIAGAWTDHLVVINREDEQSAKKLHLVADERICYMPGIGVDMSYYNPSAISQKDMQKACQSIGIDPDSPFFVMVAAFIPRKQNHIAIRALATLERQDVHLAFAGDGPLLETMKKLAEEIGVANQVHFAGRLKDVRPLVQSAKALLLTSQQEGLPRSIMEAMSLETPVIGTDIRGTRDLICNETGILFQMGDIEGLTQAMNWMLEHPDEARHMGKIARSHMAKYEISNILALHEELYSKALGS